MRSTTPYYGLNKLQFACPLDEKFKLLAAPPTVAGRVKNMIDVASRMSGVGHTSTSRLHFGESRCERICVCAA